jgi:hypothetical protein
MNSIVNGQYVINDVEQLVNKIENLEQLLCHNILTIKYVSHTLTVRKLLTLFLNSTT